MNHDNLKQLIDILQLEFEAGRFKDITRFEIINHAQNKYEKGRLKTFRIEADFKEIQVSIQDDGKTLKVFLA